MKLKKLASLLLALVMALALAVPAFATGTGTITVENATVGETYSIYKIFDATYVDGQDAASYTIDSSSVWYATVNAKTDFFTLAQVNDSTTYNVTPKEGITSDEITAWLGTVNPLPAATGTEEAKSATVVFENLDMGYYLVKSTLNGGGTLTLTNAKPEATVIDKNQKPNNFVKTIKEGTVQVTTGEGDAATTVNSVEIGKEYTYQITYQTTNFNGDEKVIEYVIKDTMPNGMKLTADSVKVYVGAPGAADDAKTEVTGLTTNEVTGDTAPNGFNVTIPWVENTGKTNKYEEASKYDSPYEITITYKATLTSDATIDDNGNTNSADVTFNTVKKDGTPGEPGSDSDTETVYTYALAIKKVNTKGEALAGAKFAVTQNGQPVNVSPVTGEDGRYVVDPTSTSNEVVTPESGLIVIIGVNGDEYTLTETAAPAGYNMLTAPVTVKPTLLGAKTTNKTWYWDEEGKIYKTEETTGNTVNVEIEDLAATDIVVVNFTGAQLPSTGGIGTTIFYIVGGVLAAGAVILLITKRRMNMDK